MAVPLLRSEPTLVHITECVQCVLLYSCRCEGDW